MDAKIKIDYLETDVLKMNSSCYDSMKVKTDRYNALIKELEQKESTLFVL